MSLFFEQPTVFGKDAVMNSSGRLNCGYCNRASVFQNILSSYRMIRHRQEYNHPKWFAWIMKLLKLWYFEFSLNIYLSLKVDVFKFLRFFVLFNKKCPVVNTIDANILCKIEYLKYFIILCTFSNNIGVDSLLKTNY